MSLRITKGLLRKDADWLLFFFIGGVALEAGVLASREQAWIGPMTRSYGDLLWLWWLGGALLGFWAAVREDVFGTREFLAQRPLSAKRIYWTRVLASCGVIAAWIVLGPLLAALFPGQTFEGFSLARLGLWVALGSVAFATFAAGHWAGTLRAHWFVRLLMLGAAGSAVLVIATALARQEHGGAVAAYFAVMLALAALGSWLASHNETTRRDVDLPRTRLVSTNAALCLALSASAWLGLVLQEMQGSTLGLLWASYPEICATKDGKLVLADVQGQSRRGPRQHFEVDAQHTRSGRQLLDVIDDLHAGEARRGRVGWARDPIDDSLRIHRHWRILYLGYVRVWLDLHAQLAHVRDFRRDSGGGSRYRVVPLPFAHGARQLRHTAHATMVSDAQGRLWRFAGPFGEERFERLELPGADRFAAEEDALTTSDIQALKKLELSVVRGAVGGPIRGERGRYCWINGEFVTLPKAQTVKKKAEREPRPIQVVANESDVFSGSITVRFRDAELTHEYEPRRAGEFFFAGTTLGLGVLRAPALSLLSYASAPGRREAKWGWLLDPLLLGGRRGLVVLLGLVFSAFLAWRTMRRAAWLGVDPGRARFWAALVFATGFAGWLAYLFLETRRAWRRIESPAALPTPLIAST